MQENEFFYRLTPQVIINAVEREGFKTTGVCWKLNSLENRVYDLELDDHSHIVVKFYRPGRWSKEQILEEHEFLFDLLNSDISVCAPVRFKDYTSLKEIEGIYYAVWKRTGGRSLDEFSDIQYKTLGRLLGRIHSVGKMKQSPHRLVFNSQTLGRNPFEFLLLNSIIPSGLEKRYGELVNTICVIYDDLSSGIPVHRIHGDCHIGNLLYGNDGFFFLDFDDFYTGPAVQDFWMLLPLNDAESLYKTNLFLEGYSIFSEIKDSWLTLFEVLRGLRFIHYAGWIAKRWEDPAFKETFSHFGSDEYWLKETNDLEEQLKIIEKPVYSFSNHKVDVTQDQTEPELGNKDIFWDWDG
ncbi:MAG: stress response serine/threonine protein kinase YihE [Spirochaetes bacterium GWF1_31_7]|nr:MAG: stress response serine/threonine protein kinase YihE [Spirochaetes bacterium GWE1_32_154]OHD50084.1 MAG: stress response serine/threonine protein kinase YihE [Spirochaetes bacterium GWE2_31_10]OHD52397.1 MAG: stress response serine/threonine protein kinase YihE [Spirochaetes bacterium GWF1_31_7]OHD82642.1 MAG: stress response serine/threonine protein kinase YihE [Spirochaetes bacterium RIFOXYB1_FULL_32_8]HBD96041.1 serine/threonine protein kinase [Spirochaetia bacterium]